MPDGFDGPVQHFEFWVPLGRARPLVAGRCQPGERSGVRAPRCRDGPRRRNRRGDDAVLGHPQGCRWSRIRRGQADDGHAGQSGAGQAGPPGARSPDGRCRLRAHHCVRQRRVPAAGAWIEPPARDRRAARHRRQPRPYRPPAVDRECRPRRGRRPAGRLHRRGGDRDAPDPDDGRGAGGVPDRLWREPAAACRRDPRRPAGAGHRHRSCRRHLPGVRARAGAAGFAGRCAAGERVEGRPSGQREPPSERARGGAAHDGDDAADWRDAVDRELPPSVRCRYRLRPRRRAGVPARAAGGRPDRQEGIDHRGHSGSAASDAGSAGCRVQQRGRTRRHRGPRRILRAPGPISRGEPPGFQRAATCGRSKAAISRPWASRLSPAALSALATGLVRRPW